MMSLISLPLGLILGIAFAGALAYLDSRVYRARDLQRIEGLRFLGSVSPRALKA